MTEIDCVKYSEDGTQQTKIKVTPHLSNSFNLVLERNKLLERFDSISFKIIIEIMNTYTNPQTRILFSLILQDANIKIKTCDSLFIDFLTKDLNQKYQIFLENKIIDYLYKQTNLTFYYFPNLYDFPKLYNALYMKKTFSFVNELWISMPEEKAVKEATKGFKILFDEFTDQVLVKCPNNTFIKKLEDINFMYRSRSWDVNDDYNLMIPDKAYTKKNRWNPDGVAYLYLACGDTDEVYEDSISVIQKTCFEEIRLKDKQEVAICKFKSINKKAKIINLCYEGTDLLKLNMELQIPPTEFASSILKKIDYKSLEKFKALELKLSKNKFNKKKNAYIDKLMKNSGTYNKSEEIVIYKIALLFLSTIDESIFKSVDEVNDPDLKAYIPFRVFSEYLIEKGYDGIIYRSTRMDKVKLKGKCLVLFNKEDATYIDGTMEKYKFNDNKYVEFDNTHITI